MTTAYGMPTVERIHIPVIKPHRLDQGKLSNRMLDIAPGMYAMREIQALQFYFILVSLF